MGENERLLSVLSDDLSFEIAPSLAGRVTKMTYRGTELLVTPDVNPQNWGATYWTSPQADWGWPPVPEVDSLPYEVQDIESGWDLMGPVARIGERVFRIGKRFVPGPHPNSIDTTYSIHNVGTRSFSMANWEIARVHPGGLTFYPTGTFELTPIEPHCAMDTIKHREMTFYDHRSFQPGKSLKLHADGREGFLAHATERHLILKLFEDTTHDQQAPGEGECEIFANLDGKYVEIEVQGPYVAIAPNTSNDLLVRTVVVNLPAELSLADYEGLAAFARKQAEKHGPF